MPENPQCCGCRALALDPPFPLRHAGAYSRVPANTSPPASVTPSSAPPNRPDARCAPLHDLTYAGCRLQGPRPHSRSRGSRRRRARAESLKKRRSGIYRAVPVPLPCSMTSGPGVGLGVPLNLVQKWLGHA